MVKWWLYSHPTKGQDFNQSRPFGSWNDFSKQLVEKPDDKSYVDTSGRVRFSVFTWALDIKQTKRKPIEKMNPEIFNSDLIKRSFNNFGYRRPK